MENSNKNKILTSAMKLFWSQGVSRTGINQIINEAGVAKASFYYYYNTKDDLIKECVYIFNQFQINLFEKLTNDSSTIDEFITSWVKEVKNAYKKNKNYRGCPISNIGFSLNNDDKEFNKIYIKIFDDWKLKIQNFVFKLKATGEIISTEDPMIITKRIIQTLEGAMTMWRHTNDISYVDDLHKTVPLITQEIKIKF